MKIISMRSTCGPNVYHALPVLIMKVDIEQWADIPSCQIEGFNTSLKELLPGLVEHTCSPARRGGFFERLERGTFMAHIIEHVALELSALAGIDVSFGKSRYAGQKGHYNIITGFRNEEGMRYCLESAFEIIENILRGEKTEIQPIVNECQRIVRKYSLGPSAAAIEKAAIEMGIPCRRIGKDSTLRLGYGKNARLVQTAVTDKTSLLAASLAQDKQLTKEFLRKSQIPVPRGEIIYDETDLAEALTEIPGPYVLKPVDGHHGEGVYLNLKSEDEVRFAFTKLQSLNSPLLLEEMCPGKDYRILIINGKLAAAAERTPPQVIGDGANNISDLIHLLNQDPDRGDGHETFLTKVVIDEHVILMLATQGLSLTSIPAAGQVVTLRGNANLSSGGTPIDVTDLVHPEVRAVCERAARLVGLDICGIDLIHMDITAPVNCFFKIIEVNAGPGLRMHLKDRHGNSRNVGADIINMLYSSPEKSRIPLVSVTGTNGKTTVVRLLSKILSMNHECVGTTTTEGVWIAGHKIFTGDASGPISADLVLSDPGVDCAVLEVARGGMLRGGLAYDWSDVGVITNVRPDHFGQDGIENIDDLLWVKSLIAERVKKDGTIVLNADDTACMELFKSGTLSKIPRKIALFSIDANNPYLRAHLADGQIGAWAEDGWIYISNSRFVHRLAPIKDLPLTMDGMATFQVANILAASLAALSAGANMADLVEALLSFDPIHENQGRMNIYKVGKGYVILDYGHNPDAIAKIGELINSFGTYKKTAVFGLPGDRSDDLIQLSAHSVARHFEKVILKDDTDLRGRAIGEIPMTLAEIFKNSYPNLEHEIILNDCQAIKTTLEKISENEIVVIFFESLNPVLEVLREFDPVPTRTIPPRFVRSAVFEPQNMALRI